MYIWTFLLCEKLFTPSIFSFVVIINLGIWNTNTNFIFLNIFMKGLYKILILLGVVSYFPQYSRAALSQLHTENSSPKELQNPLDSVSENVQDALNSEPEQETNELESTALSAMNEDRRELINKILKELDTSKKQLDSLQREELLKSTVHSDTIDKIQDSNSKVENTTPVE